MSNFIVGVINLLVAANLYRKRDFGFWLNINLFFGVTNLVIGFLKLIQ